MYTIFLLLGILISGTCANYYFVTVPNMLRFNHEDTVTVSVFGLQNAAVKVWLEHGKKKFSEKVAVVKNEENPEKVTIRVTENDLFGTVVEEKPRNLSVCSEYSGSTQCRNVILSYETGFLIVQTDKPIYTPRQIVQVRSLALDESLKGVGNDWEVSMDIISPSNMTVARETLRNARSGFFTKTFTLPPYPEIGIWTARLFYNGQFETEARAHFEVQEYVLPTFGVTIDVDVPYILKDTNAILVTVRAKYVYGKGVDGNARLTLNLKCEDGISQYILDVRKSELQGGFGNEGSVNEFNIPVKSILGSPLLSARDFPDKCRLEVIARVYESATGKEEAATYEGTVFAINSYIFKFSRSKENYRPGWEYFVKVEVLYANGQPVSDETIKVKMFKNNCFDKSKEVTTDSNGRAVAIFSTTNKADNIAFTAATLNERQESERLIVKPYKVMNQIQAECLIDGNDMIMRANRNIKGNDEYTGMLFMLVTRGQVVYTKFKESGNQSSEILPEGLQEIVSPSARLLVFYVDQRSNEMVADSVKFDVEQKCRDNVLSLKTDKAQVKPAERDQLQINGDPMVWVGLNVVDKALLLLNNKNVLRKNKMFETLEAHDLGCGEGSGDNSADVFKKTGLTVLTNAVISGSDLERKYYDCPSKKKRPKKRQTDENTYIISKCLDDETDYQTDIARLIDEGVKVVTRTDFRESWLFDLDQLDNGEQKTKHLTYPDSITTWMTQAIGVTENKGMCIAEPIEMQAFRPFFIQLDLPYKATRLEHLDIKATVFSYGLPMDYPIMVNIYMEGADNLCYSAESGKPTPRTQIELPPNSAKTVRFPMIPLKAGIFPVKVTAIVIDSGFPIVDAVEKKLFVVNEGIEEKITIQLCLDPGNQMKECKNDARVIKNIPLHRSETSRVYTISMILPEKHIPGTGDATGYMYMQCNVMDNVVETLLNGVDRLLKPPVGSGEGTIIRLAPTVYAMMYLKETKQDNVYMKEKGNQWIRDGVNRELTMYRHPVGSYATWKHRAPSTWLTAFVAKVFCQVRSVVDDAVDGKEDIAITIDWLIKKAANGKFVESMPVLHREIIGQMKEEDPSLTAFVLIALSECNIHTKCQDEVIDESQEYLERLLDDKNSLKRNPYILAITTYALALSKSKRKLEFKNLLHEISHKEGKDIYWGNPGIYPASAHAVETTAYALLAMMQFNDVTTSSHIVRWLTNQRDHAGTFRSTQETVVALQALSIYSKTYTSDVNLHVKLFANDWSEQDFTITKNNVHVQQLVENLPVEKGNNELNVQVTGTGTGRMMIDLRYNRPAEDGEGCLFEISDIEVQKVDDLPIDLPVEKGNNELNVQVTGTGTGRMMIDLRYNRPAEDGEGCLFEISDIEVQKVDDLPIDVNWAKDLKCDVCGRCYGDNELPLDFYDEDCNPPEADPNIESKFGRRKRQANRKTRVTSTKTCVEFSVRSSNGTNHGMSIVDFGLETGIEVVKSDLDKLVNETENIAKYEMPSNGKDFIVFYLDGIFPEKTNFIFRLKDSFEGDKNLRQPSSVKVYDYYNPDQSCMQFYGTGPSQGQGVSYECDDDSKQCQCLQSMCCQNVEGEIKRMFKEEKTPELKLFRYTCNPDKANYAVLVRIEEQTYDHNLGQIARGVVVKSIYKGIEQLDAGDVMGFYWRMNCVRQDIEVENEYLIIGKAGNTFLTGGYEEYKYPLMGTTLVIKKPTRNQRELFSIFRRYTQIMDSIGCRH